MWTQIRLSPWRGSINVHICFIHFKMGLMCKQNCAFGDISRRRFSGAEMNIPLVIAWVRYMGKIRTYDPELKKIRCARQEFLLRVKSQMSVSGVKENSSSHNPYHAIFYPRSEILILPMLSYTGCLERTVNWLYWNSRTWSPSDVNV